MKTLNTQAANVKERDELSEDRRTIVARHVDVVGWNDATVDCICPGDHLHGPGGAKYATVFLSGKVPTISCFHQSCKHAVAEANAALREEIAQFLGAQGIKHKPTPEEREERKFRQHVRQVEAGTRHRLLPRLKKEPPITLADWERASAFPVKDVPVKDHWRLLLAGLYAQVPPLMFGKPPQQVWEEAYASIHSHMKVPAIDYFLPWLWAGELYDTGAANFSTCPRWLRRKTCPGPYICPAEFGNSRRRAGENVSRRDFLVNESDDLPLEVFGNVVLFVAERMKLKLRAVVYTGGKSIHVWFDYNYLYFIRCWRRELRHLKPVHHETLAVLTGLGCDPKMFGPASTTRMPGCERMDDKGNPTGKMQRLVYLDPKFAVKEL